jgi:hypothetical protein
MRTRVCLLLLISLSFNRDVTAQSDPGAPAKEVTLRDAHLTDQVRKDIYALVLKDMEGSGEQDTARLKEMTLNLSVIFMKLSKDGSSSILVEGDEGNPLGSTNGIGNEPFWLFRRVGDHAVLVFFTVGQGVSVKPTFHHGMRDISTGQRMGHSMTFSAEVDEFDGTNYRPAYCYDSSVDEKGKDIKSPRHPCS